MRITFIVLFFFLAAFNTFSQEVDLLRLAYEVPSIHSRQAGMAVSPDGKLIAFVYEDKTVKIFDVSIGRFVKNFKADFDNLFDIRLTAEQRLAIVELKSVKVIDLKTEKEINMFSLTADATKTTFSGKHSLLAVGQKEGYVNVFDLKSLKQTFGTLYKKHHVSALAFHPDGKKLLVGVMSFLKNMNPLKLYDLATGNEIGQSPEGTFTMISYDETGDNLIVAGLNYLATKSVIQIWDANTYKMKKSLESEFFLATVTPYGGVFIDNKLLVLTASRSFNVYDESVGKSVFTTKSDKWKFAGYPNLGVGSYNVFPLDNRGEKFFLNASGNNINQIYDAKSNSIIAYLFSDSNDDFAIVSKTVVWKELQMRLERFSGLPGSRCNELLLKATWKRALRQGSSMQCSTRSQPS